MELNFEKLEELIKDDDKIATVASFACETQISIEKSKEVFEKYVEINKGSKEINITYILNGRKKGQDHLSISLVKDDNVEQEKELYEDGVNLIVFSIQKAKNIDFNIIALVDPVSNTTNDFLSGAIIGKNCTKRVLRKKVLPTLPPATVKGKSTIFTKQNSTVKSEFQKVEKDGDSNQNNKTKGSAQSSISSLFNKAAQNKKPEQKDLKQPDKKQKTSGLSNFFTKQPSKETLNNEIKKEKEIKPESKGKENGSNDTDDEILNDLEIKEENPNHTKNHQDKKQNKKSDLFDSDTDDEILKDLEIKEEKPAEKKSEKKKEQKVSRNKSKGSQKKKRGVNDVGNDKSAKKRKRIIVEDDSDSDDIFGSEKSESEELIEKSDEEPEPVKVEKKPLPPKNKRRKAVEKIYEDEEGYIVTKTEYVYETPSEDENEPEKKVLKVEEKPKPKIEKKASSNLENDVSPNKGAKSKKGPNKKAPSGKQPTLMNFFKKK